VELLGFETVFVVHYFPGIRNNTLDFVRKFSANMYESCNKANIEITL